MFTGIVEELGRTETVTPTWLRVAGTRVADGTAVGDSVAVSGVCLTVTAIDGEVLTFDVMAETLGRTSLSDLAAGAPVNLERAVTPSTRLGGHLVQGHVDGVGRIVARAGEVVQISLPDGLARYLVEKGSVCVDGVSLTVVDVADDAFTVSLVQETLRRTTLGVRGPGDRVNLEVDVLAKYIERLLGARA